MTIWEAVDQTPLPGPDWWTDDQIFQENIVNNSHYIICDLFIWEAFNHMFDNSMLLNNTFWFCEKKYLDYSLYDYLTESLFG